MYYLDLFSGIGGFALGAYWAGWRFDAHYFSEVDKYCVELYQKRFPEAIPLGQIEKVNRQTIRGDSWVITGGFPCQDISIAGKGEGISGERSGLWFEMWRIIRNLRPKWVIAENVGAITFRGLSTVVNSLAKIGYDCEWQDIRASDMGALHKRERIWIVAYPRLQRQKKHEKQATRAKQRGEDVAYPQCKRGGKKQIIGATSSHQTEFRDDGKKEYVAYGECMGWDERPRENIRPKEQKTKRQDFKHLCKTYDREYWAVEPDVGRLAHGIPNRVDRLRALGNSIVPQIAELLFRRIGEIEWAQK